MDQNNTPEAEFSLNDCKCYTQICGLLFRANHAYIWRSPYISVKVGGMYGWAVAYRAYLGSSVTEGSGMNYGLRWGWIKAGMQSFDGWLTFDVG
jgi:hypothetical protein